MATEEQQRHVERIAADPAVNAKRSQAQRRNALERKLRDPATRERMFITAWINTVLRSCTAEVKQWAKQNPGKVFEAASPLAGSVLLEDMRQLGAAAREDAGGATGNAQQLNLHFHGLDPADAAKVVGEGKAAE
jgi:hypothetical protein